MRSESLDARIRLATVSGLGPRLTRRLEEAFGDPVAVVHASIRQLQQVEGIGATLADRVRRGLDEADPDREWQLIEQAHARAVGLDDDEYPPLLKHIHDPPPLLFVRGAWRRTDSVALAVVGSRRCSAYGREQADRLAAACAQAGLCIVSGGARGIDTAAHRAALRVKGRTIAVLGCGLSQAYPPENADLFDAIAHGGGAVISELPMSAPPIAENFPRRNRIISGMALGVLVVEAAGRSGALITARLAAEEHHREVLAVPGRVDSPASAGCHKMIREGWAALVTNAADILDALGETGQALKQASLFDQADTAPAAPVGASNLSGDQAKLYEAIGREARSIDHLAAASGLPVAAVQSHLTVFQLRGLIDRAGGNQVKRRQRGG